MLRNIKAEDSARLPPGFKYSIITLVEHTHFWQRIWLGSLTGSKRPDVMKDWRVPAVEEWQEVRKAFLEGLEQAMSIAEAEPFVHKKKSDETAVDALLKIAVHDAYHIGQIVLLKRAVKAI